VCPRPALFSPWRPTGKKECTPTLLQSRYSLILEGKSVPLHYSLSGDQLARKTLSLLQSRFSLILEGKSVLLHSSRPLAVTSWQERVYPSTLLFLYSNWQERVYSHTIVFPLYWQERVYPYTLSCQCYSGIDLCVPPHYFNPYFPE
jgi:hypothetical protein